MIPILIPFRCDVRDLILAVVSWRSNSVLPHEGQEMYSVLEIRVLVACRMPNVSELRAMVGMYSKRSGRNGRRRLRICWNRSWKNQSLQGKNGGAKKCLGR